MAGQSLLFLSPIFLRSNYFKKSFKSDTWHQFVYLLHGPGTWIGFSIFMTIRMRSAFNISVLQPSCLSLFIFKWCNDNLHINLKIKRRFISKLNLQSDKFKHKYHINDGWYLRLGSELLSFCWFYIAYFSMIKLRCWNYSCLFKSLNLVKYINLSYSTRIFIMVNHH